jgi:hypothetical protein
MRHSDDSNGLNFTREGYNEIAALSARGAVS